MGIRFLGSFSTPPYPKHGKEVIFSGRSNVGKSSLINHLTKVKNLAKTSATPGKTSQINFFSVEERYLLVDLPGYGFAQTAKSVKDAWGRHIQKYLETSPKIVLIVQLLDIRHPPSKEDWQMIEWCVENAFPTVFVLTKLDKIPKTKQASSIKMLTEELENLIVDPVILPYTIKESANRDRLLTLIQERVQ